MHLKDRFLRHCLPFDKDHERISRLWNEIETKYTEKGRYYHNLLHLDNMFLELEAVKDRISRFTLLSFAVFYHDIIYDATSKSNEEKSAVTAEKRLSELGLSHEEIMTVSDQILATKSHQKSENMDINYLLDADLSVLGKDRETYLVYTQMIRKEYSIYPDFLYKPGRKKVLRHFLELENIFKTEYFRDQYETQAKENIETELRLL
ncbi:HD domain-containing protein [Chryseobacterium arthrosphaerae]|uniref:HD domain-containing protein n=1 Tax=Chryseobacterium arthrosphaerae TaxID=651561 RepID=UPI003D340309